MSFYDDLERNMQNPEFRRAYEEQTRQLESSPVEPSGKRLTWDQLRTHERQQGGYWDYLSGGKVWVSVPNPSSGAVAEDAEPAPWVSGPVLRKRPIPDQLDYFSERLAALLDGAKLDRDTLIAIGATVVNLGAIAAQLRKQPLPDITAGISDAEAEASATSDLTIDEVRALHPDDAAVAEVRAWIPEGTPDHALIELEAHTLRGVLAVLDGWRRNAFGVAAQRNAVEVQLAKTGADGAQWQARAEEAERELAELRAQAREEWGEKYSGGGYLTRPDSAWMDERWPVEQWAWDHTRHGGVVGRRRIIVFEDWQEIRAKDLPEERPEAGDG